MSQKPNTYKVQPGDCLSLIAQDIGVPVSELQALNKEQINNIDLICESNTLNVNVGERARLPEEPSAPANENDLCSSKSPNFIDILYVPAHPITNKQAWYAITKEAKAAIVSEQADLADAVTGSQEEVINKLNKLGILSKFENKTHTHFLSREEAIKLQFAYIKLPKLRSGTLQKDKNVNEETSLRGISEAIGISYELIKAKYQERCRPRNYAFNLGGNLSDNAPVDDEFYLEIVNEEMKVRLQKEVFKAIKLELIRKLEGIVSRLEKKAIKKARSINTDDGTYFVYYSSGKYYTSKQQQEINDNLQAMIRYRSYSDSELANKSNNQVQKLIHKFWMDDLKSCSYRIANPLVIKNGHDIPASEKNTYSMLKFTRGIEGINRQGYLVKEQCLTFDELVGTDAHHFGPKSLNQNNDYERWRDDESLTIEIDDKYVVIKGLLTDLACLGSKEKRDGDLVEKILLSTNSSLSMWAYYPTLALIRFIDTTVAQWLADIQSTIGAVFPDAFDDYLWVKQVAFARIKQLKSIARERAEKGEDIDYLYIKESCPNNFILLWDEHAFKPLRKDKGEFINEAGRADIQVVECSLLSSEGDVGWIRGPAWYLPKDNSDLESSCSKGHIKEITHNLSIVSPLANAGAVGKDLVGALKDIKKAINNNATLKLSVTHPDSAYWSNSYHWKGGINGAESAYSVDAEAQFLRYSTASTTMTQSPANALISSTPLNLTNLGASKSKKVTLALMSGQINFKARLPESGNMPYEINYYVKNKISSPSKYTLEVYNAGEFYGEFSASLYGFAGASCVLSGEFAFGPSETDGGIGVKGQAIKLADYNKLEHGFGKASVREPNTPIPKSMTAQAGAKVDLFAGVEAGLALNVKCFWVPPSAFSDNQAVALELGSVTAKVAVSAGVAFSAEMRIAVEHGKLIVIVAARFVWGPGASGSLAISLNHVAIDRFLGCILAILKESGFSHVATLGELNIDGENPAFVLLCKLLTVALMLGISLAEAALLPAVVLESFHKDALQEEYGREIADALIKSDNPKQKAKIKLWVSNLPPEILANLLNCLTNQVKTRFWNSKEDDTDIINGEVLKAQAIAIIFKWIAPKNENGHVANRTEIARLPQKDIDDRCQQFERALILMAGNGEKAQTDEVKWQWFAASWQKIEAFILSVPVTKANKETIDNVRVDINTAVAILGNNMQGYRRRHGMRVKYAAYSKETDNEASDIAQARARKIKRCTAEKSIKFEEWKINENI